MVALAGVIVVIVDRVIVPIKCARKIGDWPLFLYCTGSQHMGYSPLTQPAPGSARPSILKLSIFYV